MDLEQQLKLTLKRESPTAGFANRVVEQATRGPRAEERGQWGGGARRAIAAGLMLTAILGGLTAHSIIERREGERARDEVMLAMRIAGAKIRYAQQQVQHVGSKGAGQ